MHAGRGGSACLRPRQAAEVPDRFHSEDEELSFLLINVESLLNNRVIFSRHLSPSGLVGARRLLMSVSSAAHDRKQEVKS